MKEILIKNVTILTMDDENRQFFGWILLKDGKIAALGEDNSRPWAKANRLQCRFK